jgi:hypothetical protein
MADMLQTLKAEIESAEGPARRRRRAGEQRGCQDGAGGYRLGGVGSALEAMAEAKRPPWRRWLRFAD